MSEAKTASPPESALHNIAWMHKLGGEGFPTYRSVGKKLSFWCTMFTGPPHIQEEANHCLPARTISCLQWRIQILRLKGGGGGAVLICLPCWPSSLQSFLPFFQPKIKGGPGPGPGPVPLPASIRHWPVRPMRWPLRILSVLFLDLTSLLSSFVQMLRSRVTC